MSQMHGVMYAKIWWNMNERNGKMAPARARLDITFSHFSYQVFIS